VARSRRLLQVSFNASVFKDAAGNVRGIFARARDVTDRVRLEDQMRETQADNRGLIASSADGLVTVAQEGFITNVNEQMYGMTAYDRDEPIGSTLRQYFTDPERADRGIAVDDSPQNTRLARGTLEPFGYKAVSANSVDEGLQATRESRPDLILSDLHKPRRDGHELIKAVREDPNLKSIPFVFHLSMARTGVLFVSGEDFSSTLFHRRGADLAEFSPFLLGALCVSR